MTFGSTRPIVKRALENGIGIAIACLFWILVLIIVLVATASSKSPWDTLIAGLAMVFAGLAMVSQAFFALMVWRLSENQYAFTRQVSERQHKIDMFPLRKSAVDNLSTHEEFILPPRRISSDDAEAFRRSHLEIGRVFSESADDLAFQLFQLTEEAAREFAKHPQHFSFSTGAPEAPDELLMVDAYAALDDAINVLIELQILLDDEMRIR